MTENKFLSLDSSILYRCSQKHFDRILSEYDLGYTQLIFLTQIYENEGITMNELAQNGFFDKGTITKSIQKLEQSGYVRIESSETDKRSKLLYTTERTRGIMPNMYLMRQDWNNFLSGDLTAEEKDIYLRATQKIIDKIKAYNEVEIASNSIKFYGLQKLTLLDYPGKMASTVFTGGCNFRCPFCHNKSLVFLNENDEVIECEDILDYLAKRRGVIDGVCVTGGEPLLHPGLKAFLTQIKDLGLLVKLDTNGTNCDLVRELVDEKLVDYVAMDVKNCPKKYSQTVGIENYDVSEVKRTIRYLLEGHVDYEFRTTVVAEFHEVEDFKEIGELIRGAKHYYLQSFVDHGTCIEEGLHAPSVEEIKQMRDTVKDYVNEVDIRGIKE